VKFGLFFLPTYFPELDGDRGSYMRFLVDYAASAEELGFDSVWANEHHFSPYGGLMASVPVFLAAVAQRTKRVRLGTSVVVLAFHNPIEVAEQLAMIDLMSNGRLEFGFGRGYIAADYKGWGVPLEEGQERTNESLDVILKAWSGEPFSYAGKHYHYHDLEVWPKPQQAPHPPVWQACSATPASFESAARHGYGLMIIGHINSIAFLAERTAIYRRTWIASGRDPAACQVAAHFNIVVAGNGSEAREIASVATDRQLEQSAPTLPEGHTGALEAGGRRLVDQHRVVAGSPSEVVDILSELQDQLGFTAFQGKFVFGGMTREQAQRSLRLFAEGVIPKLRDREPAPLSEVAAA
jgi:alkanesulfonate monooxygenase SsuD/methylene tetrahydromethanopterin reductase-like flavin-dependent oxidoreductase (luciferase family)